MDSDARARALRAPNSILDEFLLTNAAFPGVVIRSRYAEDALREATIGGLRQYVLIGAGFDSFALRRPTFSDDLRAVATCGAQGSELVFTYVDQIEFAPDRSRSPHNENAQVVAAIGEPYVSGFDPNEIANDLSRVGLELVEDLDGKAMWERDAPAGATIQQPPASMHIALARVGQRIGRGS
jgi:O-methyltransferase involved in polyketide biosynthesis